MPKRSFCIGELPTHHRRIVLCTYYGGTKLNASVQLQGPPKGLKHYSFRTCRDVEGLPASLIHVRSRSVPKSTAEPQSPPQRCMEGPVRLRCRLPMLARKPPGEAALQMQYIELHGLWMIALCRP